MGATKLKFINYPVGSCELLLNPKEREGGGERGAGVQVFGLCAELEGKKKKG
jgi:hypothetical protein